MLTPSLRDVGPLAGVWPGGVPRSTSLALDPAASPASLLALALRVSGSIGAQTTLEWDPPELAVQSRGTIPGFISTAASLTRVLCNMMLRACHAVCVVFTMDLV